MPQSGTEDLSSIKTAIEIMSGKIDELYNVKDNTSQILKVVRKLQSLVELKDKQIETLAKRIDDLEQYSRIDNVIIMHGLKTRHKVWSRQITPYNANTHGENSPHEELETLEEHVVGYLNSHLHVNIQSSNISTYHTLKSLKNNGKNNTEKIIIRFVNRKKKNEILKKCKNLRGTKVFINEHLTKEIKNLHIWPEN